MKRIGLDLAYRLRDYGYAPTLIAFGGKPVNSAYMNRRAEMYFALKKTVENGLYGLTEDIKKELAMTRYIQTSTGKLQIIPKGDIKLNLGHSPDTSDALALTCCSSLASRRTPAARKVDQARYMLD